MEHMSFFAKRYTPPQKGELRLRMLERYIIRQGENLYVLLNRMDKRLEALEKQTQDEDAAEG